MISTLLLYCLLGMPLGCNDDVWQPSHFRDLTVVDMDGVVYTPQPGMAMVLVMVTEDCPIANAYQPEIRRLTEWASQPHSKTERVCRFVLVHANPGLSVEKAQRHREEYGVQCAVVLDPEQLLAKRLQATVTPQAFLIDDQGTLLYRGRIDDRHADYGKKRSVPQSKDLENALGAWRAAEPIAVRETTAIGCRIRIHTK